MHHYTILGGCLRITQRFSAQLFDVFVVLIEFSQILNNRKKNRIQYQVKRLKSLSYN